MQTWREAPIEKSLSERHKKHTIERAVAATCSESQKSPASSKYKASDCFDQWKPCVSQSRRFT
jgi:hypothetical protein